jgi:hypothetical protein
MRSTRLAEPYYLRRSWRKPSSYFTTGFLNGFFSAAKNQQVKETKCIVIGDPYWVGIQVDCTIKTVLTPKPAPPSPPPPKGLLNEFKAFLSQYKVMGMAVAFIDRILVYIFTGKMDRSNLYYLEFHDLFIQLSP